MQLVITLRKEVANPEEGESLYELVKTRFQDQPNVEVTGHVTNHFVVNEEPS